MGLFFIMAHPYITHAMRGVVFELSDCVLGVRMARERGV